MSIELSCPYTGKTVRVQCNYAGPGPAVYFQVGAWSPSRTFKDGAEARRQMLRRGATWLEDKGRKLRCPYLGTVVSFVEVPGGVKPTGMYDPDRTYTDADAIYHALGMRGGVPATGTVPEEVPYKLEVKHEDSDVPFEIQQMEQKDYRAKTDGLAAIKEIAGPAVAEVFARSKK